MPEARHAAPPAERLLQRLEWKVLRRLDGLLQGGARTLLRGAGIDLADLREYQYHDDVRHIDWNVTARLQQPYVRQFTEDRELAAWFLVDLSASVDFGSDLRAKRGVAREFVGVLSRLLTRAASLGQGLHGPPRGKSQPVDRPDGRFGYSSNSTSRSLASIWAPAVTCTALTVPALSA